MQMQSNSLPRTIRAAIAGRSPLVASVAVFGWSLKYLVSLSLTHTTGPELYGVLTAALATGAGVANLAILRSARPQLVVTVAVLMLWALIAIAGIGGTVAHIVGPVPGHGPMDLRPRPVPAPLIFTLLGVIGGAALFSGQRAAARRARNPEEE
jgi:hypothetical protein